jgi:hypothetical protein
MSCEEEDTFHCQIECCFQFLWNLSVKKVAFTVQGSGFRGFGLFEGLWL